MPRRKKGEEHDALISNIDVGAEIEDTDFGLIFDQDGNLKMIMVPDSYMQYPPNIKKVFKAAGIPDLDEVQTHTLH